MLQRAHQAAQEGPHKISKHAIGGKGSDPNAAVLLLVLWCFCYKQACSSGLHIHLADSTESSYAIMVCCRLLSMLTTTGLSLGCPSLPVPVTWATLLGEA